MGDDVVITTYDQARFKLDADVRRCWVFKGSQPIVYKNGSKIAINVVERTLQQMNFIVLGKDTTHLSV